MVNFINRLLRRAVWEVVRISSLRQFRKQLSQPAKTQRDLLFSILRENRSTSFGSEYNFSCIQSIDDFRRKVPIHQFSDLSPWLDRERATGLSELTTEEPFFYTLTSGSSGDPKYIPITRTMMKNHRRSQLIALQQLFDADPEIFSGSILTFMSPAIEGVTDRGVPYGSMSGLLYQKGSKLIASQYAVPSEVFSIKDFVLRQKVICLFSLASSPISLVSAVNPLTLLVFEDIVTRHKDEIIHCLKARELPFDPAIGDDLRKQFLFNSITFSRNIELAIQALMQVSVLTLAVLFPKLRGVVSWTAGNCGYFARKLKLPSSTTVYDAGYLSSEFRGSLLIDQKNPQSMPTIHENFFEFIEPHHWDAGSRETLLVDELTVGRHYYIIATTQGGLYRYFINDIVQAEASAYQTLAVTFVQKGGGVANLAGEKVYENHILAAFSSQEEYLRRNIEDFVVIADLESQRYLCFYESKKSNLDFSESFDNALMQQNLEYKSKRESGRLEPIQAVRVRSGTFYLRKDAWIKHTTREGQYKAPKLLSQKDLFFDFSEFVHHES